MKKDQGSKTSRGSGPLVVIGGAEDRTGTCVVLREFVRLAGGERARVIILTVASDSEEAGVPYVETFARLGAKHAEIQDVRDREQTAEAALWKSLKNATGVFFTGGDQLRVTTLLGGTPVDQILRARHEAGMVLGGTSAGAAMMSGTMIIEGLSEGTPRLGNVKVGPGMDFLHGAIIDQHFGQRGRSGRLLSALAQYPHQLGIGIDEDTALVVQGDKFSVIGAGAVTVLDAGSATYNNVLELREPQHVALCGVTLHVLTAGLGFHLLARTPVIPRASLRKRRTESKRHEA